MCFFVQVARPKKEVYCKMCQILNQYGSQKKMSVSNSAIVILIKMLVNNKLDCS